MRRGPVSGTCLTLDSNAGAVKLSAIASGLTPSSSFDDGIDIVPGEVGRELDVIVPAMTKS